MVKDLVAYAAWLDRKPCPGLKIGDWVTLAPPELGGGTVRGKILLENGSHDSWGVTIPYGEDGALIYVHKADLAPAPAPDLEAS